MQMTQIKTPIAAISSRKRRASCVFLAPVTHFLVLRCMVFASLDCPYMGIRCLSGCWLKLIKGPSGFGFGGCELRAKLACDTALGLNAPYGELMLTCEKRL